MFAVPARSIAIVKGVPSIIRVAQAVVLRRIVEESASRPRGQTIDVAMSKCGACRRLGAASLTERSERWRAKRREPGELVGALLGSNWQKMLASAG